jgi:8-oxo-dGTP diphosphatase
MSKREYPERPVVGVGGVVIQEDRVVLVRRAGPPLEGEWSIPGGALEVGETIAEGVRRELREETGLDVRVLELIEVFERILPGEGGPGESRRDDSGGDKGGRSDGWRGDDGWKEGRRPQYHFVILDYLCAASGGALRAGGDASDVALVAEEDLAGYLLTPAVSRVLKKAFSISRARSHSKR